MGDDSKGANQRVRRAPIDACCNDAASQRIGILTFHRCINYGSYWQARQLAAGLSELGHRVEILDHASPQVNSAEWRVALRPTLPIPVSKADEEAYACKARKFFELFQGLPLSKAFDLDVPQSGERYDTIVIGSDEVWNLRHPWYAGKTAFFGVDLPADRVVSYAASFGNYSCWEGLGPPWTDFLERLDAISVRDENSWWMLKNCIDRETEIVLDPCLQFPPEPQGPWRGPQGRFALLYGHNFSPTFISEVKSWAAARRLPLLSIGYRNDWADAQWLTADPLDFAHAVAKAEAVATNFFHGCVFSLLNSKPFACELTPYRSIKVRGLMELLGGEAHLLAEGAGASEFAGRLDEPVESSILRRVEQVRESSNAFLRRALGVWRG